MMGISVRIARTVLQSQMTKISNARHSRGGGNPVNKNIFRAADQNHVLVRYAGYLSCWIPACAGMTAPEFAGSL
jgi:hypothetical protein